MHDDIAELRDMMAQLAVDLGKKSGSTDKLIETLEIELSLKEHVKKIVKDRTIVLTGDTEHLSINYIVNTQFANIDKPRKYDFQPENVNEEEFLRSLLRALPNMAFSLPYTKEEANAAIAGEGTLSLFTKGYDGQKCYDCGESIRVNLKGNSVHLDCAKECAKNEVYSVEIDCPSGEFVYGDWPDRFSEAVDAGYITKDDFEINYLYGIRQSSEAMAKQGILHMFVGNSCPSLYINPKNSRIRIGETSKGYEKVGYFCTDLWWVTMIDRSRYEAIMAKLPQTRSKKYYTKDFVTAKVEPGRYRFTTVKSKSDDVDNRRLYVKAERIGDSAPLEAIPEPLDGKRIRTPNEVIAAATQRYKTLYTGETEIVKFRTLDYIFNTTGNGLQSKGDFYTEYAVPADEPINETFVEEIEGERDPRQKMTIKPYPNYDLNYSFFTRAMPLAEVPSEWLEAGVWFYQKSEEFFKAGGEGYQGAWPMKESDYRSWVDSIAKHRKPEWTDAEFYASVTKNWYLSDRTEIEFKGDLDDWLIRRWEAIKAIKIKFCQELAAKLQAELDSRK